MKGSLYLQLIKLMSLLPCFSRILKPIDINSELNVQRSSPSSSWISSFSSWMLSEVFQMTKPLFFDSIFIFTNLFWWSVHIMLFNLSNSLLFLQESMVVYMPCFFYSCYLRCYPYFYYYWFISVFGCIIIIGMRSELREEAQRQDLQQQNSTHTFILKKIVNPQQILAGIQTHGNHQFRANIRKPVLNLDGKHFTPAFISESECGSVSVQQQWAVSFGERVQQQCMRKIALLIPRPRSLFCFVCKEQYQDYLKHINHPIHKKWRDASYCEEDIKRFIQEFQIKIQHKEEDSNKNNIKTDKHDTNNTYSSSHLINQQQASICSTKFLPFD